MDLWLPSSQAPHNEREGRTTLPASYTRSSSCEVPVVGVNDSRDCAVIANTVMKDHLAKAISIGRK